jgi:hypothetical protein
LADSSTITVTLPCPTPIAGVPLFAASLTLFVSQSQSLNPHVSLIHLLDL